MTVTGWSKGQRPKYKKVGNSCPFSQLSSHPVLGLGRMLGILVRPWARPENLWKTVTLLLTCQLSCEGCSAQYIMVVGGWGDIQASTLPCPTISFQNSREGTLQMTFPGVSQATSGSQPHVWACSPQTPAPRPASYQARPKGLSLHWVCPRNLGSSD